MPVRRENPASKRNAFFCPVRLPSAESAAKSEDRSEIYFSQLPHMKKHNIKIQDEEISFS